METDMNAAIARLLPRASATLVADPPRLFRLRSSAGSVYFLSWSVLILDQYIPGDWFSRFRPPGVTRAVRATSGPAAALAVAAPQLMCGDPAPPEPL